MKTSEVCETSEVWRQLMNDAQERQTGEALRRWLAVALVVTTLALAGWLGWRAVRTGMYTRAALADLDQLQAALAEPSLEALPRVQAGIASLDTHLKEAQVAAGPFLRLAPHLGWAPRLGPDIASAPQLLEMAVTLSTAGRTAMDALAPVGEIMAGGGGLDVLPQTVEALQAAQPRIEAARAGMARAAQIRASLPPLAEPRLAAQLAKLDALLPLATGGLELAALAPALLGADGPRTYLLLAQNNDELRGTGGFISGAGHVTFERGKLTGLTFADSYAVDNFEQPHTAPPAPLARYMAADLWLLRDSNWSPDFPEAADVARALYLQDRGIETDGAVALDLEAVRLLVGAVGPLQVPGIDQAVTGDNAIQWMKAAWQAPVGSETGPETGGGTAWWEKRKDFMGELVKAALARVQGGADIDMAALARAAYTALDARNLQVSLDDPAAAALLAQRGWDGGVRPPADSDFLLVVDSNVGFNKANMLVRQRIDYAVEEGDAGLEATLRLTYTHTAPLDSEPVCNRAARYGATYDDLAERCYWSYLRVYAPGGSELISAEGLNDPATEAGVRNTTIFAGDFVLKPGEQHLVTLRYRLPPDAPRAPYRLFVRKQAGASGSELSVTAGACHEEVILERDFRLECP